MKIRLHPLFIVLGLAAAVFGGFPVFIIYALTALLHECGHIFCAARLGFRCEKISLMPYGAAAVCDTEGISPRDEIKLALSGPAVNALICIATAGLWWFFPVTYAYTDTVFYASAVMLAINLLPAYPLDGGRVVRCLLIKLMPQKTARILLRVLSGLLSAAFVLVFFLAYKNISLLVFAVFLLVSAIFEKDTILSRVRYKAKKPKRGKEIKHVMLSADSTFKDALRHVDSGKYLIIQFYGDGILDEICEDELFDMLQSKTIYDKILQ
ncbi:MAG: hypothetical protein K2K60_05465 [Clostridia bacterium]|nr:hypothetical protein [Clostridia bacterium]